MKNLKKVLIAMSAGLIESLDQVAAEEYRNRSDCVREAIRLYINTAKARKKLLDSNHVTTILDNELIGVKE